MAIEFLGHKESLIDFILPQICDAAGQPTQVIDLFCGSGSVSRALKRNGFQVLSNDHLYWCATAAKAILQNGPEPKFAGLASRISFRPNTSRYAAVLEHLNDLAPRQGFIFRHYTPASSVYDGISRMYFTEENGAKIDAVREKIQTWKNFLTDSEFALLVTDLVLAANAVSNIAGTYGCYLKTWKRRAQMPLRLLPSALTDGSTNHQVFSGEAMAILTKHEAPIIYADPPYTKRQYAAYYHLLETIALGDEPSISGSTGLRNWKDKSSDFCYRRKATAALHSLLKSARCRHFFLSYNDDGQIAHEVILKLMGEFGSVKFFEKKARRYKSSALPHKGNVVTERLYQLTFKRG